MTGVLVAATAALAGCAGDDLPRPGFEPTQVATPPRVTRAPATGPIRTRIVPRAVDASAVTVVAMLDGPSVADLQETAARKLTRAEKAEVKARRIAEQAAPRARIEAAGGTVVGSFQSALNGIKVRIARDRVAALRAIPGVVDVVPVMTYRHDDLAAIQRIQAPFAWAGVAGVRGEGVKIAIIDTGIDYTHADFGGPGTVDAFRAAAAASTQPAAPALFGPAAPKVKGGIDLVGDAYDAGATGAAAIPVPDPNPLDCDGHGTHVAGIAAGFGVLAGGATYRGPYDQQTLGTHDFAVGPGVAPGAELYAVRVFGCTGTTDAIAEALEWVVDNDMDVANLSLGAAFGTADSADAVAADSAVKAGVVVVAAAGNDDTGGLNRYLVSSPAASSKAIAVAAGELPKPSAELALPAAGGDPARTLIALDANAAALPDRPLTALVLRTGDQVSLGCDPAEYIAQGAAGKLVIVQRGDCGRVIKAVNGQLAGAAAVVMINTENALPPFEGPIKANGGEIPFDITIPFLGARGPATDPRTDGFALALRHGAAIAIRTGAPLTGGSADFSSEGPRVGDSALKPDILAPGEAIASAQIASGGQGVALSGTSMASPLVAGTAALAIQAHPRWKPAAIKSAILNAANPDELTDYVTRRAGAGTVSAAGAAGTQAFAFADRDQTTLNVGLAEFVTDLTVLRTITVRNDAPTAVTFSIAATHPQGSPHQVALGATRLTVPARSQATLDATITVPAATAGNSDDFRDFAGLIALTPIAGGNRGIALHIPYYGVPRVSSSIATTVDFNIVGLRAGLGRVTNAGAAIAGTADLFSWGLQSPNAGHGRIDLRAAGVQAFDIDDGRLVIFAVNTHRGWSSPATQEFDILIDSDGDQQPDFDVFNIDFGLLVSDTRRGQQVAAILDLHTGAIANDVFNIVEATDTSTMRLALLAPSIGVTPANPRFSYTVSSFDLVGTDSDAFPGAARFNAFTPAVSNAEFAVVPPGGDQGMLFPIEIDRAELALTPARGWLVFSPDNPNGPGEAQLIPLPAP